MKIFGNMKKKQYLCTRFWKTKIAAMVESVDTKDFNETFFVYVQTKME